MDTTDDRGLEPRRGRARFADIAAAAGVSAATVDRVLNERGSVSPGARERVVAAARQLGVARTLPDARYGIVHLDVILPLNPSPMFRRLALALDRTTRMLDRRISVHRITMDHRDDAAFARAILEPPYRRSGLAVVGSTNALTSAALRAVAAAGEAVAVLVSEVDDVPGARYVGIDNAMAGRTAGHAIARLTRGEGRVLVLRGHHDYRAHDERVAGCLDEMRRRHPGQPCLVAPVDTLDDPDRCYHAVREALADGPIAALYNSGDGSTSLRAALERSAVAGRIVWIGHEMHDDHARSLLDGSMEMVIDQDPDGQALHALQHLLFACGQPGSPRPTGVGELRLFTLPNARREPYLA